jgi:hypothetical protein
MAEARRRSAVARSIAKIGRAVSQGREAAETREAPSSFEQVTRRGLEDLTRQVERLELKINGVFLAMLGALLAELYRTIGH